MALPWWLPLGRVPEITPEALLGRLEQPDPPVILDVRTPGEFAAGHLRGAVSAPILGLRAALDRLDLPRGRPVVAICLSAHRSIPAVRLLRARGHEAVQLAGGMLAWRARKLPEERG